METRPANSAELAKWDRIKKWFQVISMQNSANGHRLDQIKIGNEFLSKHNLDTLSTVSIVEMHQRNVASQVRFQTIIAAVEDGAIGLSFPQGVNGPMDIKGPLAMTDDEIQSYQLGGIAIVIGGVMIIAGLSMKVYELYTERLEPCEHNEEVAKDFIQKQIDQKPELHEEWEAWKAERGWNQNQDFVDALTAGIDKTLEYLKKPVATGIAWSIPVIAGVFFIYMLAKDKK